MNLFNTFKMLATAKSHDILDKVVDLNSPAVLKNYARELEEQVEALDGEDATAEGAVRTSTHQVQMINDQIAAALAAGKKVKEAVPPPPGAEAYLKAKAAEIVSLRQKLALKQQELDSETAAAAQLGVVLGKVKAKSQEINARIRALETEDAAAKTKLHAATIIGHTSELLSQGGSDSINDLESKIHAQSDVADAKLEHAVGSFTDTTEDTEHCMAEADVMKEFG